MPFERGPTSGRETEEARLDAALTRELEQVQAETTPPRLLALARALQRKLRERED
jgi:hypothetical protein